jgi:hypothetical protein
MAMDTKPQALVMAFRTAPLFTDAMKTAEAAVMQGIGGCEDLSLRGLLIDASRSAVQRRTRSSDRPFEVEGLHRELRRLFVLPCYGGTALFCEFWRASRQKGARNFSRFLSRSSSARYMQR